NPCRTRDFGVSAFAEVRRDSRRFGSALGSSWPAGYDCGMVDNPLLNRIQVNPKVVGGRPTIKGHRIWVSLILGCLADGMSVGGLLADYPGIEEADVRACFAYGAHLAAGHFADLA